MESKVAQRSILLRLWSLVTWCTLSLRSPPIWGPLLCCLKLSREIYFRLKLNLGVLFQRALEGSHAVLFLITAHAGGCSIHLSGNCLVYPQLSSLVVDLCSKNCSSSTDSAHSPHLGGTDAVLSGKSYLCHILLMTCAFNPMLLIDTFLIGLPQCSLVPSQSEISPKSISVFSWTKESTD